MRHRLATFLCVLFCTVVLTPVSGRQKLNFNADWLLWVGDHPDMSQTDYDEHGWQRVTLPHAFNEDEASQVITTSF